MSGYLIDTNVLSAYYHVDHPKHPEAKALIDGLQAEWPQFVSCITLGEVEYGIQLAADRGSSRVAEMRARAAEVRRQGHLPITVHTATEYARVKGAAAARVKTVGKHPRWVEEWTDRVTAQKLQLDENDLWLCAQALERDLTLVTLDTDFQKIKQVCPSLKLR